jgi:hypothetical protein
MAKYYAILTDIGTAAMANAAAMGNKINVTQFAVGDGSGVYYQPSGGMTALKNEVWRGNVSEVAQNEDSSNIIDVTGVIPSDAGGFTIREMGVFDASGKLIAVANTPDTAKVVIADGTSSEMSIKMQIAVSNADVINFTLDPTVIIATKRDLEKHTKNFENPHKVTAAQVGASNPNLLINGDFQVAQRGSSFIPLGSNYNIYTLDRWFVNTSDTDAKIYQASPDGLRIEQFASSGISGAVTDIAQFIENYKAILGKQITYSVRLKLDAGVKGYIYIYDGINFYTSPQITGDGTAKTVVETATISLSGTRLMCSVRLFRDSLPVGSGLTVGYAKLELGSVATPFSPRRYAEELALCQRYYISGVRYTGMAETTTQIFIEQSLPCKMRVTPTAAVMPYAVGSTGDYIRTMGRVQVATEISSIAADSTNLRDITCASAVLTIGTWYNFIMQFDAEIY